VRTGRTRRCDRPGRLGAARRARIDRRRLPLVLTVVTAIIAVLPACADRASAATAGPSGSAPIVFVEWPVDAGFAPDAPASFRDPCPSGSRVVGWDPDRPDVAPWLITANLHSAGLLDVSPDGQHVLVCARREAEGSWQVFELGLHGGQAVALSPPDANATGAAYLAGDRVVFSSDMARGIDPADGGPAYDLYTCERDGTGRTRISFNPSSDIDPTVLPDGRILYGAWQPPGDGRPQGGWGLFTVRLDGTGLAPFYGSHDGSTWKRRPAIVGDLVAFLAASRDGGRSGMAAVSLRRPLHSLVGLAPGADGSFRSVHAGDAEDLLVSYRPAIGDGMVRGSFGLYLLDDLADAEPLLLRDDPDLHELDAMSTRPRRAPRGHVSSVDPSASTGELLCLDARRTDREVAPEARGRTAVTLLVLQGHPRARPTSGAVSTGSALQDTEPYEPESSLLASLPLASDGSVLLEVPADTPLRFQTIDADGELVQDSRGWAWLRPGEKRSCIGCHADRETAPPNRAPAVLSEQASAARAALMSAGSQ